MAVADPSGKRVRFGGGEAPNDEGGAGGGRTRAIAGLASGDPYLAGLLGRKQPAASEAGRGSRGSLSTASMQAVPSADASGWELANSMA